MLDKLTEFHQFLEFPLSDNEILDEFLSLMKSLKSLLIENPGDSIKELYEHGKQVFLDGAQQFSQESITEASKIINKYLNIEEKIKTEFFPSNFLSFFNDDTWRVRERSLTCYT